MDPHTPPEDTALLCDLLLSKATNVASTNGIEAVVANVEVVDIDGHTALHFCCLNGLTEAAKVLVSSAS